MFTLALSTFPDCWRRAPSCPSDGWVWWTWANKAIPGFFVFSKLSTMLFVGPGFFGAINDWFLGILLSAWPAWRDQLSEISGMNNVSDGIYITWWQANITLTAGRERLNLGCVYIGAINVPWLLKEDLCFGIQILQGQNAILHFYRGSGSYGMQKGVCIWGKVERWKSQCVLSNRWGEVGIWSAFILSACRVPDSSSIYHRTSPSPWTFSLESLPKPCMALMEGVLE